MKFNIYLTVLFVGSLFCRDSAFAEKYSIDGSEIVPCIINVLEDETGKFLEGFQFSLSASQEYMDPYDAKFRNRLLKSQKTDAFGCALCYLPAYYSKSEDTKEPLYMVQIKIFSKISNCELLYSVSGVPKSKLRFLTLYYSKVNNKLSALRSENQAEKTDASDDLSIPDLINE